MGWETRGRKRIYYRKERFRDEQGRSRVRSIYCGSGERGEAAARGDQERKRGASPEESASPAPPSVMQTVNRRSDTPGADAPAACYAGGLQAAGAPKTPGPCATAVMQRCTSDTVDVADTPTGAGRSEPPAPAVTAGRRYRHDPLSPDSPYRYFVVPRRRKPPARPGDRRP